MRMRISAVVLAGAAVVAASLATVPAKAATAGPQYTLVLGSVANAEYVGINNNGDIIGIGTDPLSGEDREEGFILKAGTTTPVWLGAPGDETDQFTETQPRSINDQDVVVGNYQKSEVLPDGQEVTFPRATIWQDSGTGTDLGVNPGSASDAFGINDSQQVVGTQSNPTTITPWLLQGTTVTNLPAPNGDIITEANGINASGVVVGDAAVKPNGHQVATEWVNGKLSSLGTLNGGTWAEALAINSSGQAVGAATTPGNPVNLADAVMFVNGKAVNLNAPGAGQGASQANAINDHGVIVGEDGIDPGLVPLGNGFIYRNGQATELNTLIAPTPNVRLASAFGINNAGDIVGIADVTLPDGTQASVGYELLPITTP